MPVDEVVVVITCPVAVLLIVTLAPATTAPEGSVTVPATLPVLTGACRDRFRAPRVRTVSPLQNSDFTV